MSPKDRINIAQVDNETTGKKSGVEAVHPLVMVSFGIISLIILYFVIDKL